MDCDVFYLTKDTRPHIKNAEKKTAFHPTEYHLAGIPLKHI